MVNSWGGGYQGGVTVKNTGSGTISGWKVGMTLPSGQSISQIWSGSASATSGAVTVSNVSYNGTLGAGAGTAFGFIANAASATAPSGLTCTTV
jgi:cellulase/cellobiase CelA1